jgi:hypothetical protein
LGLRPGKSLLPWKSIGLQESLSEVYKFRDCTTLGFLSEIFEPVSFVLRFSWRWFESFYFQCLVALFPSHSPLFCLVVDQGFELKICWIS